MLHVASVSTPCCMLLDVVVCCCVKFETGQTFQPTTPNISFVPWSPKRSATMLDSFAPLFQHCWGHARSLRMVYKDLWWVVSFPRCSAGPNIVGSCCIRLHATANTPATTPKIVGVTMLGVVASVCTQPKGFLFTSYFSDVVVFFRIFTFYLFLNWFSTRVSDARKYVCSLRLYACINTRKFKGLDSREIASLPEIKKVIYMALHFNHRRK